MVLWAKLVRAGAPRARRCRPGLLAIKDVPSVIYGHVTFDPATRRVQGANYKLLLVTDQQFVVWDGTAPAAG